MTLDRFSPSSSDHAVPADHGPAPVPAWVASLRSRSVESQVWANLARREAGETVAHTELLISMYRELVETCRQLCAERRKLLEEADRWMDQHGMRRPPHLASD